MVLRPLLDFSGFLVEVHHVVKLELFPTRERVMGDEHIASVTRKRIHHIKSNKEAYFIGFSCLTSLKSQTSNLRFKVPSGRILLKTFTF